MPVELLRDLDIRSKGFGIEPEVTAKLLSRGIRPYEVPITYRARSRAEGKKLTWQTAACDVGRTAHPVG